MICNILDLESPVYRAFDELQYAEDFLQGKFRLGSLCRYRGIEDKNRRDGTEGYGSYIDSNEINHHIENGNVPYILSLANADVNLELLAKKMGPFVVQINEPMALASEIEQHLEDNGTRTFNGVHGRLVEYSKGGAIDRPLDQAERFTLSIIQKLPCFSEESEYRLFTIFNQAPRTVVADYYYVNLGDSLDYVEIIDQF